MKAQLNIEERKPIWKALSDLYLDNELQDYDFRHMASVIVKSPYSLEEVKQINRNEVFPVLHTNLLSVAGEWAGFDEEWLVSEITKSIKKRNLFSKLKTRLSYKTFKWMTDDYWEKLEKVYLDLNLHQ